MSHAPSRLRRLRRLKGMNALLHRSVLALLGGSGAATGVWAYVAPRHWYHNFPGFGMSWLPQLGPYNEHFVKDVGAMFLALAAVSAVTFALVANQTLVRVTALMWLVFNTLHCIYHLSMLQMYNTRDATLNGILLPLLVLAAVALFSPVRIPSGPSPRLPGRRTSGQSARTDA
jgi:tryptophan-rich sensory protein